jgi:hypothetical protein
MANGDDVALRGERPKAHARAARSRARRLLAQYRDLTRLVAATGERVAETMDRMAAQYPVDAGHFRSLGLWAREQALLWRQRAARWG